MKQHISLCASAKIDVRVVPEMRKCALTMTLVDTPGQEYKNEHMTGQARHARDAAMNELMMARAVIMKRMYGNVSGNKSKRLNKRPLCRP